MPAYNPPPQVLFSPVTNHYQGKAIRAGLASQEQDAELKGLQIDAAKQDVEDAPARKAQAQKTWQMQYDSAKANLEGSRLENGEKTMEFMAQSLSGLTSAATEASIADGNTDRAIAEFNKGYQTARSSFPESIAAKVSEMAGPDKVFDAEEVANLKMSLAPWFARDPLDRSPRSVLVDGQPEEVFSDKAGNMYFEDGSPVLGHVTPFATNEGGVIGGDPRTPTHVSAAFVKAKESFDGSENIREAIGDFIPRARAIPDSVGGLARLTQVVSAGFELLGANATAEQISSYMSDTDQETLASMAAQMKLIRGQIRPLVTGDRGARQSDKELEIANRTIALTEQIETPLDLLRNFPQVMGGMKELYVATLVNQYNEAKHTEGLDFPFDLSSADSVSELSAEMTSQGISNKDQIRFLLRLSKIQGVKLQ